MNLAPYREMQPPGRPLGRPLLGKTTFYVALSESDESKGLFLDRTVPVVPDHYT